VGAKTWNEEVEIERVKAKAMIGKFGSVGKGCEGKPRWKQDAGRWLNCRSEGAKRCV
jgi:hypothetical protein